MLCEKCTKQADLDVTRCPKCGRTYRELYAEEKRARVARDAQLLRLESALHDLVGDWSTQSWIDVYFGQDQSLNAGRDACAKELEELVDKVACLDIMPSDPVVLKKTGG